MLKNSLRRRPLKRTPTVHHTLSRVEEDDSQASDDALQKTSQSESQRKRSIFIHQRTFRSSMDLSKLVGDVEKPSVGLALSGGGMRSAMYCSGVLRSVLEKDVRVDFLSSVSGGGYAASSYMEWKYREGGIDSAEWHERYFNNLLTRAPNAFFRFDEGFALGAQDFLLTALAVFLNVTVVSFFATGCILVPMAAIFNSLAGDWMRAQFNRTDRDLWVPGSQSLLLLQLALAMLLMKLLRTSIPPSFRRHVLGHALWLTLTIVDCALSVMFIVFVIEGSDKILERQLLATPNTESRAQSPTKSATFAFLRMMFTVGRLAVYFLISLFSSHRLPSYIVLVIVSYVVHLMVFAEYTGASSPVLLNCLWWSFLLCPVVQPVRDALFFHLYRHNMAYAFYHPSGRKSLSIMTLFDLYPYLVTKKEGHFGWKHPGYEGELTVGDLSRCSPEWICQMTLNDWLPTPEDTDDFKILTVSSKLTDVIDFVRGDVGKYLHLKPCHIKVSTAMGASAAAFHNSMGRLNKAIEALRAVFLLIGISIGITIPSSMDIPRDNCEKLQRMAVVLFLPLVLVLIPWMAGNWGSYVVFCEFVLLLFFATFPTGQDIHQRSKAHQIFYSISRWVVIHLRPALFFRELLSVKTVGKYPDFVLNVSDGGHIENLGLLPLLRRRTNKIIIADGGLHQSPFEITSDLTYALQAARWSMGCRFTTMEGGDVEEAIIREFVRPYEDQQPHCFKFKVHYTEPTEDGEHKKVDEGEILIVQPRHPRNLYACDRSGEVNSDWSVDEADALTGILVRGMHGRFRSLFHSLVGIFPSFGTHWLVLTPQMVSALHEEGRRGMRAPIAEEFLSTLPHRSSDCKGSDKKKEENSEESSELED